MNGRIFAGARALYRAAGVDGKDFGKPIVAIANSFDEFVPGHVHLNKVGRLVSEAVKQAGGIPREFNTMAVDDGIAMGHTGMLYSLPSREIIADTVEYQVNAHCADALICISNCDKITPGMLMAALRLNIPTVFVSGGPMEAGTTVLPDGTVKENTDLIDVMYASADDNMTDEDLLAYERTVCPTCGSCAGMFTANSMNCLNEAIGLALPGNGTVLASHGYRKQLFERAAQTVVDIANRYYQHDDESVLPRSIATKHAFENAMTMDVAMGGSTAGTTVLPDGTVKENTDLIDVMYASADDNMTDEDLLAYERTVCPTCGSCAGMFTANSMNCLNEAIGLALPGNGTVLASHGYRKQLFERAAQTVVDIANRYYQHDDESVLPRSIATKHAFENAMTMDVAMGGSTNTVLHILAMAQSADVDFTLDDIERISHTVNTVLHILAMAQSADVDFTLDDIERISHTVPCICKASPSGEWEISDVHRAGGITGILGELDRAGKLHRDVHSVDYPSLEAKLADWDIMRDTCTEEARDFFKAAPGHIVSPEPWTHETTFESLDTDRVNGAIHDIDHPAVTEGGLAVLRGNLAPDGCVVKTAGVPKEIWTFRGPALVVESQEQAIEVILNDTLKPGQALIIRYEGPKGGPGMQEMLYPTSFVKGKGIGKEVALITDGRYSGGSSGLSIGHVAPEAASGGPIALVENGDMIVIDIPNRTINVELSDEELAERRAKLEAGDGYVAHRDRQVSQALKAFAAFARSADKGATRDPELINKLSGLA